MFPRSLRLPRRRWLAGPLLLLIPLSWLAWHWFTLPDGAPFRDRRATRTIQVLDWHGEEHPFLLGPRNPDWTPLNLIPASLKWSVILAEDAGFYRHRGLDLPAIEEALKYDLKRRRLARGASTITQQLAKNLFLTRHKSFLRKAEEAILARRLERELGKARILELYLNLVELGPMVHGVGAGARYQFHRPVAELTPAQGAFLAAILPGPRLAFNPERHPQRVERRAARILGLLKRKGVIDEAGLQAALAQLTGTGEKVAGPTMPAPQEAGVAEERGTEAGEEPALSGETEDLTGGGEAAPAPQEKGVMEGQGPATGEEPALSEKSQGAAAGVTGDKAEDLTGSGEVAPAAEPGEAVPPQIDVNPAPEDRPAEE